VNPDQQIRAAAVQTVATLMAGSDPATPPADVIAAAVVVTAFIEHGADAALALCFPAAPETPTALVTPVPAPTSLSVAAPVAPKPSGHSPLGRPMENVELPDEPEPQQEATVIPLAARGETNPKQAQARRRIEEVRFTGAMSIYNEFQSAKALAHKNKLRDKAEDAGLLDFVLTIGDETKTLGAYLGMPQGS
jgi:hypothetical protein